MRRQIKQAAQRRIDARADQHIVPLNDLVEHDCLLQCLCRPQIVEEIGGRVIIHHAYDGREYRFEGGDVLSEGRPN